MTLDPDFIAALAASDICSGYYTLCDDFPLRVDQAKLAMPVAQIKQAAQGRVAIEKLAGPGRVYRLSSLPDCIALNFIISSQGNVDTDLTMTYAGQQYRTTFAIMCNAVHLVRTGAAPQPPYPRPRGLSADELVNIMERFAALVSRLPA